MSDREGILKTWDHTILETFNEDGVRQSRIRLADVHIMIRGEDVEYAIVTGRMEDVVFGPPKRGRPKKRT